MPLLASAIKKLRHDRKITKKNEMVKKHLKEAIKTTRKKPAAKLVSATFSTLDKAAKSHVIHKNKANRLKSRLAKLLKK